MSRILIIEDDKSIAELERDGLLATWRTSGRYVTEDEQKTMMTLWCIFGAPLMLGAEMTKLDAGTLKLLTNRDIISLQQYGENARQLMRSDDEAVWTAYDPEERRIYIAIFNLSEEERGINFWINQILSSGASRYRGQTIHEVWTGSKTVSHAGGLTALIPAHGVRLFWYEDL